MSKLLTSVASAAILMAAGAAYANDYSSSRDRHADRVHNAAERATIQKGQSASMKGYGLNKQGDQYSTRDGYRDEWNNSYNRDLYPGSRAPHGSHQSVMIKRGGSASDSRTAEASRQYGTYWQ